MVALRLPVALAATVAAAVAFALPAAAGAAEPDATCASTVDVPGGEWRSYGHDYANTRFQPDEKVISGTDVATLSPSWTFATGANEEEGDITGTPIVAGGCVYVATNQGWVNALNADTGEVVWKAQVPYGGGVSSSPGLTSDTVYVAISRTQPAEGCPQGDPCVGPYVAAFDRATGDLRWASSPIDDQPGADVFGSPVVFRGILMLGVSGGAAELGDEADRYAFQGSMNFLDAATGELVRKTWTIHPPGEPKDELAGAGIWSTPALDRSRRIAYAGTGNPYQPQAEARHANSVLAFDVDPDSPRFGHVVGSYKGLVDEYLPGFSRLPCYDIPGNPPPYYPQGIGSCGDIDLDFGSSPNLFTTRSGRELVGVGQKSGVYHVFDARTMKPVWKQIVGPPGSLGGIVGSTAYDGNGIYGPITVPGYVWSLRAATGATRWAAPVADGVHWGPPVAVANGVVYTVDLTGYLDAFDARSGLLLAKRPLVVGGGGPLALSWGGVSVARNTIYAAVGIRGLPEGFVIALRRGTTADALNDVEQTPGIMLGGGTGGGGGGGVGGSAIVAGPGATNAGYATPVMAAASGGTLTFVNLDIAQHDVTASQKGSDGRPLFQSRLAAFGQTVPVEGLDDIPPGQYGFFCSIHPGMRGTLIVR